MPSNRQGKEEIESVFQTPLCHILCDENAPNSAQTVKLILRLLHAKLAFTSSSPKKEHLINAHYAETWGLFEIASFLQFSFGLLFGLLPRISAREGQLRACMCTLPRVLARTRASADFCFLPSPFTDLPQLTVYQHTRGEHLSTLSPSPFLHLPSPDSPQPATEKSHFFQHFPRISLATPPASQAAKSATEQVKAFSSKPSPFTL